MGLAALLAGASAAFGDLLSLVIDLEDPGVGATAGQTVVFGLDSLSAVLLLLGLVGLLRLAANRLQPGRHRR